MPLLGGPIPAYTYGTLDGPLQVPPFGLAPDLR